MRDEGMASNWNQWAERAMLTIREWWEGYPEATLTEIETAVDGLWAKGRTQLIQELALAGVTEDWADASGDRHYRCAGCGGPMERRGRRCGG